MFLEVNKNLLKESKRLSWFETPKNRRKQRRSSDWRIVCEKNILDDDFFTIDIPQAKVEIVKVYACTFPNPTLENRASFQQLYLRNEMLQW